METWDVLGEKAHPTAGYRNHPAGRVARLIHTSSANAAELMAQADIDGALVGGASLDPDDFARIVKYREHQSEGS